MDNSNLGYGLRLSESHVTASQGANTTPNPDGLQGLAKACWFNLIWRTGLIVSEYTAIVGAERCGHDGSATWGHAAPASGLARFLPAGNTGEAAGYEKYNRESPTLSRLGGRLPMELSDQLATPRAERHRSRIDVSKAGCRQAVLDDLSGLRVGRRGVVHLGPVEDIEEFRAHTETHSLAEPEGAPEAHLLIRTSLISIVVEVDGRDAKLSRGRLRPGGRVQNECFRRVEAVAIQIVQE